MKKIISLILSLIHIAFLAITMMCVSIFSIYLPIYLLTVKDEDDFLNDTTVKNKSPLDFFHAIGLDNSTLLNSFLCLFIVASVAFFVFWRNEE